MTGHSGAVHFRAVRIPFCPSALSTPSDAQEFLQLSRVNADGIGSACKRLSGEGFE